MPQRIYTATLRLSFATKNENKKRLKRGVCWKPPGARGRRVWFRSSRERTGVDGIEADRVDQAEHDFLALRIISGNGEAEPSRCLERYAVCFNAGSLGVNSSIIAA